VLRSSEREDSCRLQMAEKSVGRLQTLTLITDAVSSQSIQLKAHEYDKAPVTREYGATNDMSRDMTYDMTRGVENDVMCDMDCEVTLNVSVECFHT